MVSHGRLVILLFGILHLLVITGDLGAWIWPDTGQTKCFNGIEAIPCPEYPVQEFYGQDAQYQGPERSYTKLGRNGTVLPASTTQAGGWLMTRDNVTGLIWEMKTGDGGIHDKERTFTWCDTNPATNGGDEGVCGTETGNAATDTKAFIQALNTDQFGGYSDWQMPTIQELSSLGNLGVIDDGISKIPLPAIDNAWFPNTKREEYWSAINALSSSSVSNQARYVDFIDGRIGVRPKYFSLYVRAVRGGNGVRLALVDNGDGTVTDPNTGLMWQKNASEIKIWSQALSYTESLTLAGYTDWRLPNRNELHSLVDYSRWDPAMDPLLTRSTGLTAYWSSTTAARCSFTIFGPLECLESDLAWRIGFTFGNVDKWHKDSSPGATVRAVRNSHRKNVGLFFQQLLLGD